MALQRRFAFLVFDVEEQRAVLGAVFVPRVIKQFVQLLLYGQRDAFDFIARQHNVVCLFTIIVAPQIKLCQKQRRLESTASLE